MSRRLSMVGRKCYETRIFRIAQRIAHSREDAEDIKQNAFVQAFKIPPRFRGDSRFFAWLGRITINEGLMKLRSRRVKEISLDDAIETEDSALVASSGITGQILNSAARKRNCGPFSQR